MRSVNANRLSRKKRGVSPIIATILLVAITVVLAAVLYILVTGLIGGGSKTTNTIGLGPVGAGTCTTGAASGTTSDDSYTFQIASTSSSSTTTSQFGLSITDANHNTVPDVAATASTGSCPGQSNQATSGWIAVLEAPGTATAADYWSSASNTGWDHGGIAVTSGANLIILVPHGVSMTGDQLSAFPLGSNGGITLTGGSF